MKRIFFAFLLLVSVASFAQPYNGGIQSFISTANSSSATLGISGVFTGTSEDVSQYADIRVSVFSDVASATDGLSIQQSKDGSNWDFTDVFTIPAATGKVFSIGVSAKFYRVVYTNGGTGQATFRLTSVYHKVRTKPSSQRPQDARTNDNDFEENLSYNMGYNGTTWDRLRATTANGLAVDITRNAALVAGSAIIGKVGIDQTTPGTTNKVSIGTDGTVAINTALPTGANTIGAISNTAFTANAGTNLNTSALALESGGNLATLVTRTPILGQAAAASSRPVTLSNENIQDLYVTGQSAQTATVNNILTATSGAAATDLTGYRSFSVQVVSTGTGGTYIFEGSNDNTNFQTVPVYSQLILTGTPITAAITATSSQLIYIGASNFRYFRLRIATTITGGSIQAFSKFSQTSFTPNVFQVAQATGANLNMTPASTPAMTGIIASAAEADATANPTGVGIRGFNNKFNGSTWDRDYGMGFNTTTGDAGAKTATGNGATITNIGNKGVQLFIVLGTVSGTTPTCTFKMQGSVDGGTNWYDIPGATTASLTASTNVGIMLYPGIAVTAGSTTTGTTAGASGVLPRAWRIVWTIGGTTPSFAITSVSYNYIPN